jgi:hypothetical protein
MNKHRSCAETSAEIISCGVQPENGRVCAQVPHSLISAELTSTIPVFRVRCATVGAHLAHVAPRRGGAARPTKPGLRRNGRARLGRGAATANSRVGCLLGGLCWRVARHSASQRIARKSMRNW